MKPFYSILALSIILASCGSGEQQDSAENNLTEEIDTTSVDTTLLEDTLTETKIEINLNDLLAKFTSSYNLPYSLDSAEIENQIEEESESNLTNIEVQYLSQEMVDNKPTSWAGYSIQTFIDLDSLKIKGEYEEYLENIDIAMMQEASANSLCQLNVSEESYILMWTVSYSTYEACPYSSGDVIFGTLMVNDEPTNTLLLGEDSGGGDAPYWGSTFVTSEINSSSIKTLMHEESGGDEYDEENDEEVVEVTEASYDVTITAEGFVIVE